MFSSLIYSDPWTTTPSRFVAIAAGLALVGIAAGVAGSRAATATPAAKPSRGVTTPTRSTPAAPTPVAIPAKSPATTTGPVGTLNIRISGLRSTSGNLCLSVFNRAEGFPAQPNTDVKSHCVSAKQASRIQFDRLVYGDYAIAVLHDENSDGKVNSGMFGVPQEGFGFSRNPKVTMRSPSFQETAIPLNRREQNVSIRLNYF